MKFKGIIESVELKKQGITNNKPWSIFEMYVSGKKFSTFDQKYQEFIGQEVELEYEEKESNGYVNLTAKDMNWKPGKTDKLSDDIEDLKRRVTALEEASDNIEIDGIPM